MSEIQIDVVTDIVCPWCFIGVVRLHKVLAENGIAARVVHHPFFLDPSVPPEGIDVAEKLRKRFGGDPSAMFARVEAEARKSGIALDLSKQPRQRPTAAAHTLIRHALEKGTQDALATALFEAHFMDARNVADPDVLAEIGARFGFSAEEARRIATDPAELEITRQEAAAAAEGGISGVPFFVFNRQLALSGCQPEDVFEQALAQATGASAAADA
ncbi:DsbA family oxidoreductase [Kaistia nematophila]|uniref:DsbA family oxidoreductase n=1 Tax=Kaistia nematophila TaxID=2994654 RepID=A0A9X3E8K6_9HYPH|nr:DsbA family oxidoreductase [Kaistia nematophila]MCX5568750.1 DsbA family oxidoreductase [Kaistia nematophila]